ncbi:hypothetical protein BLNAU_14894 [Blattamonas nauphoetae]|uniref:Uncharacterized protein n=1 Tax=Blattamonas nauphoetae TaxID=2049346 RepID=A0ABQ9XFX0_9EUKA|nr:hypothetical protein BLNAU_14894 [Blattamonas nauphoetae]
MKNESVSLKASNDALSNESQKSPSTIVVNNEPFLTLDPKSKLSFKDHSTIYNSLVSLVKGEYHFDKTLQDRAAQFLKILEPQWNAQLAAKLVTELVPSTDGSAAGFVESIVTLVSSPHSTMVVAALSLLHKTILMSSTEIRHRPVQSDLVSKVFATVQPHTLPISGNDKIFDNLLIIIYRYLNLAVPLSLRELGITAAVDQSNHREMIFQKVVLPSSQFFQYLISNRNMLKGELLNSFMSLLTTHLRIGPFHDPTLEFVIASPIVMAFSSCLSFIEDNSRLWVTLQHINYSFKEWKKEGPEVVQSGKRMIQALISEGFEDTLEQKLMSNKGGDYGSSFDDYCHSISQRLGSNVEITAE